MLFELTRFSAATFAAEARKIIRLAFPILVAQVAQVGTGVVDTVMAGRVSANDLAAVALGSSVFVTVYVTLIGVLTALNPILSHLYGANEVNKLGETGRQGLWCGLLLGVVGMLLLWLFVPVLRGYLQLGDYVEQTTAQYVGFVALGLPAALLHRSLHAYASSLNKPKPIMWVSIAGLILNIPLNYVFIHGLFGLPRLGGAGCGLATALVFVFNASALWWYVAKNRYFQPFGLMARFSWPQPAALASILKLGAPIGLSFFLEVSLFTFIALLIAQFGVAYVASQQVVINISSLVYMLPQSLGVALSVCVGHALGMGATVRARYVAGVGLAVGCVGALMTAVAVLLFRHELMRLYTKDVAVIGIGATLLIFNAVFQVSDAIQTIASGALRGYKITKVPMLIHALAFWGLGLGLGSYLGLVRGMGIYGFWTALVLSLFGAAVALVWYLARSSRAAMPHFKRV